MATEENTARKRMPRWLTILLRIVVIIAAGLVLFAAASLVYLNMDTYSADDTALAALNSDQQVTVSQVDGGIAFVGPDADADNTYGLIFYPGAKVASEAYAPLMHTLAANGWVCVVAQIPFSFAFLQVDAATGLMAQFPQVEHWYVGGHSLGGVVASTYAGGHSDSLEGIVFAASYTSADLSSTDLRAITVYGTEDGVMNMSHYADSLSKLPADNDTLIIEGGNHGQMGSYGGQSGDNEASITPAEQWEQVARFVDETAKQPAD